MKCAISAMVWILAVAASAARADTQVMRFYGYAYELASGKYLYTEVYRENVDGGHWQGGETRYYGTDGALIADKVYTFPQDPYIPIYSLNQPAEKYSEGISSLGSADVDVHRSTAERGPQAATVPRATQMAADCGFHSYVVAHFAELMAGKKLKFRFVVAGQLAAYDFRAERIADIRFEDHPAVQLKIEPDSLLRFLVSPLVLTYDPRDHRLLEYRGVTNVINPATGKAYNARISYYTQPPDDAPKNLPPLE
jgi:hypothetical protein